MNYTITTTISAPFYHFLEQERLAKKTSKKSIIEEGLRLYKREKLRHSIQKGLKERNAEYQAIANDFADAQAISLQD